MIPRYSARPHNAILNSFGCYLTASSSWSQFSDTTVKLKTSRHILLCTTMYLLQATVLLSFRVKYEWPLQMKFMSLITKVKFKKKSVLWFKQKTNSLILYNVWLMNEYFWSTKLHKVCTMMEILNDQQGS